MAVILISVYDYFVYSVNTLLKINQLGLLILVTIIIIIIIITIIIFTSVLSLVA